MSTHFTNCVLCGKEVACSYDSYVFGCGGDCFDDEPKIEFCSRECFDELKKRMAEREKIARELYPDMFGDFETEGALNKVWSE